MPRRACLLVVLLLVALAAGPARPADRLVVFAWGANDSGQLDVPAGLDPIEVHAGSHHSCARQRDGTVVCWGCADGERDWGQCESVRRVRECRLRFCRTGNLPILAMVTGHAQSCGINSAGAVECWGCKPDRQHGQCVLPEDLSLPQVPPGTPAPGLLAAGHAHSCVLLSDGQVRCSQCEKMSDEGQCSPPAGLRARRIAANHYGTCAITLDGTVTCWGYDAHRQMRPPPDLRAVDLALGRRHGCALAADGTVTCWGCAGFWSDDAACRVPEGLKARQIVAGNGGTCAIDLEGRVQCWGCAGAQPDRDFCRLPAAGIGAEALALYDDHVVALGRRAPDLTAEAAQREAPAPGPLVRLAGAAQSLAIRARAAHAQERTRRVADFVHPLGLAFVTVPAGSFVMGSCGRRHHPAHAPAPPCLSGAAEDPFADDNEFPQRPVTLAEGFQISAFETTIGQYRAWLTANGTEAVEWERHNAGAEDQPAVWVTWHEARAFAEWLNATRAPGDDGHYRLPTEAEWEYVARAGTTSRYWWGDAEPLGQINCDYDGCIDGWTRSAPVGSFPPNPWGLYEILGNVDEWVEDCYHLDYAGAPVDGSARTWPDCPERVARGGSFVYGAPFTRSAWRDHYEPATATYEQGFRLVRMPGR